MGRSPLETKIMVVFVVLVGLLAAAALFLGDPGRTTQQTSTSTSTAASPEPAEVQQSFSQLIAGAESGKLGALTVDYGNGHAVAFYDDGVVAKVSLPADNGAFLQDLAARGVAVNVHGKPARSGGGGSLAAALLTPLIIFGLILLVIAIARRRARKSGGFGAPDMSLRKDTELSAVPSERFADVAGCDEAIEELAEIVDFFNSPQRFRHFGAKAPSGIMLYGEPGTGKTLLAKSLAGEAGVPFFATSGSDFVEKFVGVGASRVRELFEKARANPRGAVIFIDEIDAVGRVRGGMDGNGEREQTLNQILVELDGFSTNDRVLCIAATNRLDVLDPALLRPGRFGRHIAVPLPAADGRAAILRLHAADKPLAADVDLDELAVSMNGLSGAQLAEVVNEAAIMAARDQGDAIHRAHFREGYLRVLAGPKRRSAPIAEGELEVIAAHEAGHVLAAEYGERYEKAQQVTVEPRGQAMGLAVYGQTDRALHDPEYLHEALVATLAGRAAEQIVFNRISSGAANDLQKATELARRAVEELGFSPRLGHVVAGRSPFSEQTRTIVDSEIERMVADAYNDALALLTEHRAQLDVLRETLHEQRVLERVDILAAIGRVVKLPSRRPAVPATDLPLAAAEGNTL